MNEETENAKFTAVIPAFNEERFVARAIESVLSQTVRPCQIVVVDDGSTDSTAAVIGRYAANGVEYVHQNNGGLASARNTGIKAARGKYVGFLDADDEWKDFLIDDVKKLFEENRDLAWACSPYVKVRENGDVHFVRSVSRDIVRNGLIENWFQAEAQFRFSCASSIFVKRAVFHQVGDFDTSISHYGEDLDMWFRIALIYPQIGYTDRIGAVYWEKQGSITNTDPRNIERALRRFHRTESHALAIGGTALQKSEEVVLDWVWRQIKEAAVQGNSGALEHISRYYGRRLSIRHRLVLDIVRLVPIGYLWKIVAKLGAWRHSFPRTDVKS
jgi:glycosyltransferase involved in cell wall biosynthesis